MPLTGPGAAVARQPPPRVLILTASIGEGHDRPARMLAASLIAEIPGTVVEIVDFLSIVGGVGRRLVLNGSQFDTRWGSLRYDLSYRLIAEIGPTRRLAGALVERLGAPAIRREISRWRPDVVVSTYPAATEALGRLRATGALSIPAISTITDLSGLRFWAHPGIDLHLITHPEAAREVRALAPGSRVRCVRGLSAPAFYDPPSRQAVRRRLGLSLRGILITVSGGGWGVGDLSGAVATALEVPGAQVICLAGRNEGLRAELESRFGAHPRVRVRGFTEQMCELLVASDVLVHSTGGGTVLEATMVGCPVVSYGWGRGHVRLINAAYRREGLAEVASTPAELGAALDRSLSRPRLPARIAFGILPTAASEVHALTSSQPFTSRPPSVDAGLLRKRSADRRRAPQQRDAAHQRREHEHSVVVGD